MTLSNVINLAKCNRLRFKEVTYGESLTDVVFDGLEGVLVRVLVL